MRHAVDSRVTVDQAIGVLAAVHRLASASGFGVLREVSQHTETVIARALGQPLPEPVGREPDAAVRRRSRQQDARDAEAGQDAVTGHGVGQGARACSTVEWQPMTWSRPTSSRTRSTEFRAPARRSHP
ncbi:ANTAR domain-containing protein [Streptomyces sp. NPDC000070]|uniref:ANTAR domain-containing protein n=1 Tax=Streptomyces sp. NPDC000070 TaxID=3154240 RepID=UPI00331F2E42